MTNKLRDEAERLAKETLQRWSDGCVFHEDGRIRITINGEGIDANRDGVSLLKGITTALLAFKGEERIFEVEGNRCPQCGTENLKIAELEQQLTDGGKLVYSEYKSQKETIAFLKKRLEEAEKELGSIKKRHLFRELTEQLQTQAKLIERMAEALEQLTATCERVIADENSHICINSLTLAKAVLAGYKRERQNE
jgi:DNA repair exonuclease SbcCD ATPase subunit